MLLANGLQKIVTVGTLRLTDAHGTTHLINGTTDGPTASIRLHDGRLHKSLLTNPWLNVGEAYMDGTLTVEEGTLGDFLEFCCINVLAASDKPFFKWSEWLGYKLRWLQQYNPVDRSKRNVAHHYDLSGQLYDLFLDNDRQYSCAYFTGNDDTLETAQQNKKQHIAAQLLLEPGQTVLDIGCGWGGLALHLARQADVKVIGVTLSEEQHKIACQRVQEADLADRVDIRLQDYREVTEKFDRIVSVGMFEHVGAAHFREFFARTREMLTEDGVFLLHSIGRMEPPGNTNAWLRKYIFPGGYSPAMSEVIKAIELEKLYVTDIEVLRMHYARTLSDWYDRFQANRKQVAVLYDERFCRMWEFYLKGCEVAFKHWNQMVFQMQIARDQMAVPLTRDYISDYERSARDRDRKRPNIAA